MTTGDPSYNQVMRLEPTISPTFIVTLGDGSSEIIDDADAYVHEHQMTVFYRCNNSRGAVDCWSTAVASVRTADVALIRRVARQTTAGEGAAASFDAVA